MKLQTLEQVRTLQNQPSKIRNICILAHVDHGKTTIADSLVASNGIISKRNAGKIRYMDSRPDEQERGITMKSSAITLIYEKSSRKTLNEPTSNQYLINLIDSPGHVDFSSEVTTAVRLCDGAIVVVDVVEGVCPQTQAVLRQAWIENIRPVLVLNKIDRLICQLQMDPTEAFYHLIQILEQMNLFINQLSTSNAMERLSSETHSQNESKGADINSYDWTVIEDEEEHKNIYFSPDLGNVIFASAIDGWGFTMQDFIQMYATKLGIEEKILQKTLWGDYYINIKAKRIMKGAQLNGKKPLFVQFVLDNIWAAYDAVVIKKDSSMIEKIIQSLGLSIPPRDLRHKDDRVLLQAVMSQWLPLSNAILDVVTTCLPSPLQISDERIQKLMCNKSQQFFSLPKETQNLKKDFEACNSSLVAPVIVYISKMFPMDKKSLPHNKARPLTAEELHLRHEEARQRLAYKQQKKQQGDKEEKKENLTSQVDINDETIAHCLTNLVVSTKKAEKEENENDYVFIAIARIFSGTIRKGSTVFFLGPKHDPEKSLGELYSLSPEDFQNNPELQGKYPHITAVQINDLYLLMGRELEALEEVSAGNVLGIGGLESTVLKSGTLSSTVACPAFTDMFFDASPIVRVAVEPVNACDMGALVLGLKLLNQADPCVEVRIQETGEHVIIAAGEVHLQRCIDDIRERYGKIEVNVSKPIVPFRETVILPPKVDMVNESIQDQVNEEDKDGLILASTIDKQCHLLLRAAPLPGEVADILHQNQESLKSLDSLTSYNVSNIEAAFCMTDSAKETLLAVKQKLKEEFDKAGSEWIGAENCIWCFGPRRFGPNILLNHVKHYKRPSVWHPLESNRQELCKLVELDNSVITGFQMATLAGPLCEEPMHGVCIILEDWWFGEKTKSAYKVNPDRKLLDCEHLENKLEDSSKPLATFPGFETVNLQNSLYGPLSGQLISTVKEGCRRAFQAQPQRLMAAMYSCEIQANIDVLGKLHGVLAKRYGKVLSDDLMEGTAIFHIKAVLPVVESFGFAEDMRKKTSGLASPQLKFSHWEVIPVDPFWVPTTEEEYMHFGEKADAENRARIYMNQVRKRKGLSTNEKIVEFAEKQRTLSKNK